MSTRDSAILQAVTDSPGDYAAIRTAYESRTGRVISCSATLGALKRLRKLNLVESEPRLRAAPIFYVGKS
jgi:hypothetical protein